MLLLLDMLDILAAIHIQFRLIRIRIIIIRDVEYYSNIVEQLDIPYYDYAYPPITVVLV